MLNAEARNASGGGKYMTKRAPREEPMKECSRYNPLE